MLAIVLYIVKINICITLFYALYRLLLRRLSFYSGNRWFLLSGIVLSLLLPLVSIKNGLLFGSPQPSDIVFRISNGIVNNKLLINATSVYHQINGLAILYYIFLAGICIFITLFAIKLISLFKLINKSPVYDNKGKFRIYRLTKNMAPFSFWRYIFINPDLYSPYEVGQIVAHENLHCAQYHTVDIVLGETMQILCWFNPAAWFYNIALKQNLEFLTDNKVLDEGFDSQRYQMSLLLVSTMKQVPFPVTFFTVASFKQRLFMMNRGGNSSKWQSIKYVLLLPVVITILCLFNTRLVFSRPVNRSIIVVKEVISDLNRK